MKKIWLWNHYATSMYNNKGGRHFWFAQNLIEQGYEATIFCANAYHNKPEQIDTGDRNFTSDEIDGIPFVFVKTTTALDNGPARIKNMILFYKNLLSAAKTYAKISGKPDVIIASSPHPLTMVAGIQMAKKCNIPCICEVRDLWPEAIFRAGMAKERSLLGKLLIAGERWIYHNADALIFTKEGDVDYIVERRWDTAQGGSVDLQKCHYINNGLDLDAFQKLSEDHVIDDEDLTSSKFNVVYAGAIRPVNNVGMLLDAAAILKNETDIQFLIYGEGNQLETLRQRVIDEGLTNEKMKGYDNKQFIPYNLGKSSVNILNYSQSQYNWARGNSSNKLFEYMASGKPIISTVKMGYCLLNKYQCGLSLEHNTAADLAQAILQVRNMPPEQYRTMSVNARMAAKDFDVKTLSAKVIDVIEYVSEQRK